MPTRHADSVTQPRYTRNLFCGRVRRHTRRVVACKEFWGQYDSPARVSRVRLSSSSLAERRSPMFVVAQSGQRARAEHLSGLLTTAHLADADCSAEIGASCLNRDSDQRVNSWVR